jgi:hypothetical protein
MCSRPFSAAVDAFTELYDDILLSKLLQTFERDLKILSKKRVVQF